MTETPAEVMRRAAGLMRERAEAATAAPWKSWIEGRDHCGGDSFIATEGDRDLLLNFMPAEYKGKLPEWEADQDHIASWHPLVALAVADLLEREAALIEAQVFPQSDPVMERYPLAVARAYLGEENPGMSTPIAATGGKDISDKEDGRDDHR